MEAGGDEISNDGSPRSRGPGEVSAARFIALLLGMTFAACSSTPGASDGGGGGAGAGGGSPDASMTVGDGGYQSRGVDCSGEFGPPVRVLDDNALVASPAITGDELELFYARDVAGKAELVSSVRGSKEVSFPAGVRVASLDDYCTTAQPERTLDVTADGLRVYFVCRALTSGQTPLIFASRSRRTDPFVVQGQVGSVGNAPALFGGELQVLAPRYGGTGALEVGNRASTSDSFGPMQAIPELSGSLNSPTLSEDGLVLFVTRTPNIVVTSRPDAGAPFGSTLTPVAALPFPGASAEISADCRTLYFVGVPDAGARHVYAIKRP